LIYEPVVATDKQKSYLLFPAIILMPAQKMSIVFAGGIHMNCLSLGYRLKVSDLLRRWTRGEQGKLV
jgi:hypothetical protein